MPPSAQVVAAVIVGCGKVLLCQRRVGDAHPLKWEFPGGKVEAGETPESALRRELNEELGIDASVGDCLWHTAYRYPRGPEIALSFFAITAYAGTITNRCFADVRWVPISDVGGTDLLAADREFVKQVIAGRIELAVTSALPPA